MQTSIFIVVAVVLILILIWNRWSRDEDFATKHERATVISAWFQNNTPNYSKFRRDTGSNIVEYEDALVLKNSGKLTVENLL